MSNKLKRYLTIEGTAEYVDMSQVIKVCSLSTPYSRIIIYETRLGNYLYKEGSLFRIVKDKQCVIDHVNFYLSSTGYYVTIFDNNFGKLLNIQRKEV